MRRAGKHHLFRHREIAFFTLWSVGVFLMCGCQRSAAIKRECTPCLAGFIADQTAEAQLLEIWTSVEDEFGPDARRLDLRCLCFGDGESMVIEGGNLYLPARWTRQEQVARAAHLALHRRSPPWESNEGGECAARVHHAVRAEAQAHALELETRRALSVTAKRYPFETDYFERSDAERRAFLVDYFSSHPQGDGTVPGFVTHYESRCAAEAAKIVP